MPAPDLFGALEVADRGDVSIDGLAELQEGGYIGPFTVTVPHSGSMIDPHIFASHNLNSFSGLLVCSGVNRIDADLIPLHPVTLTQFSDTVNNPVFVPFVITAKGDAGNRYGSFGLQTSVGAIALSTMACQLRWIDNIGVGIDFTLTYALWGLSCINRGSGVD